MAGPAVPAIIQLIRAFLQKEGAGVVAGTNPNIGLTLGALGTAGAGGVARQGTDLAPQDQRFSFGGSLVPPGGDDPLQQEEGITLQSLLMLLQAQPPEPQK